MVKKKILASVAAVALVICCAIGGTLAWLTDKTEPVVNTFTVGDVDITLAETTGPEYKMVPGYTIAKDPKVTVTADSEDCLLFVKVDRSDNFDTFMTYTMADGWNALPDTTGVYYRQVNKADVVREFSVLAGDQVAVRNDVTKKQMDDLTAENYPTLTFTAYAVQQHKSNEADFTPAEAWNEVSPAA